MSSVGNAAAALADAVMFEGNGLRAAVIDRDGTSSCARLQALANGRGGPPPSGDRARVTRGPVPCRRQELGAAFFDMLKSGAVAVPLSVGLERLAGARYRGAPARRRWPPPAHGEAGVLWVRTSSMAAWYGQRLDRARPAFAGECEMPQAARPGPPDPPDPRC
jgi:hypothetical protein